MRPHRKAAVLMALASLSTACNSTTDHPVITRTGAPPTPFITVMPTPTPPAP
jgi:hypothetical protein